MKITNTFKYNNQVYQRGSGHDFNSRSRYTRQYSKFITNKNDLEVLNSAEHWYNRGQYALALNYITYLANKYPRLALYFRYYISVCKKNCSNFDLLLSRYFPFMISKRTDYEIEYVGCKWCGKEIRWIDPDIPSYGFAKTNLCHLCKNFYPAPDWTWDSVEGRSYSYYRKSFPLNNTFYDVFEDEFNPEPLIQERQN